MGSLNLTSEKKKAFIRSIEDQTKRQKLNVRGKSNTSKRQWVT